MTIHEYLTARNENLALIAQVIKNKAIKSHSKKSTDPTIKLLNAISALSPEDLNQLKENLKNG